MRVLCVEGAAKGLIDQMFFFSAGESRNGLCL